MYIKIQVQWTYNDIHNNHGIYTIITVYTHHRNNILIIRINLQSTLNRDNVLTLFLKASKGNNQGHSTVLEQHT